MNLGPDRRSGPKMVQFRFRGSSDREPDSKCPICPNHFMLLCLLCISICLSLTISTIHHVVKVNDDLKLSTTLCDTETTATHLVALFGLLFRHAVSSLLYSKRNCRRWHVL